MFYYRDARKFDWELLKVVSNRTFSGMSANLQMIHAILGEQTQAGRPCQATCSAIAAIKDLCDLNGGASVDWRRGGTVAPRGGARPNSFRTPSLGAPTPARTGPPPRAPAPFNPVPAAGSYNPSRYKSKFQNSSQHVEDKILNNIILSKLNKFSASTYADVRDFLYQILGSGEPDLGEMVRQFMLMVFKKAASEELYCALYAKLLAEISTRYGVILEEMQKLQTNYLEIFDDVVEVPEGQDNYDVFVEKNKEKRYRQGYSQFLAELAALEILDLSNLEKTFRKLTDLMLKYAEMPDRKALIEEYADCLVRMSKVLKKKSSPFFVSARMSLLAISKTSVDTLISKKELYPSLSPKARFTLMDVKDNLI